MANKTVKTVKKGAAAVRRVETKEPAANAGAEVVEKKGGPGLTRTEFDFTTAVHTLVETDEAGNETSTEGVACVITDKDDDGFGLLTALPSNYNHKTMKALKKTDFAVNSEASFFDYKAVVAETWAETYTNSAKNYRQEAATIRKYGNADQRKIAIKMDKMRAEYALLQAQMGEEGIEELEPLEASD